MQPRYTKTRKRDFTSHLIGVPLNDEVSAVCVVLWQSAYFKNVIALGITETRLPHEEYPETVAEIVSIIDTGANVIRAGFWHVGPKIATDIPVEISTRIVAERIWINDQAVRACSDPDRKTTPELSAAGVTMVVDYIQFLDHGAPDGKFFHRNKAIMSGHMKKHPVTLYGTSEQAG